MAEVYWSYDSVQIRSIVNSRRYPLHLFGLFSVNLIGWWNISLVISICECADDQKWSGAMKLARGSHVMDRVYEFSSVWVLLLIVLLMDDKLKVSKLALDDYFQFIIC